MTKALSLFSGGLDSSLAVRLMLDQGVAVTAVHFHSVFTSSADPDAKVAFVQNGARELGVEVIIEENSEEPLH